MSHERVEPDNSPRILPPLATDGNDLASASVRRKASRILVFVLQIFTFVALMSIWQVFSATGILDPFFFSRPSDIALRIWDWLVSGFIWEHLATTLIEALLAFAIGTLAGVVLGLAFARVELIAAVFDPYIRIFNALPRVILAPIFLLWFGLGIASKVALGVTLVFFVVFFNTYQGVREVDLVILNNARMLQATDRQLLRHVYLPSAMAWIFSSLHTRSASPWSAPSSASTWARRAASATSSRKPRASSTPPASSPASS